ncbi:MAG: hypothetical protein WCG47_01410 [Dermatophilaceae bacterium]
MVLEGLALGGCPINAIDLAKALRTRGHNVAIAAIDEQVAVSLIPYAESAGFQVELLPSGSGTFRRAAEIRGFAARHAADVVHVFAPFLAPPAAIGLNAFNRSSALLTNWKGCGSAGVTACSA